MQEGNEIAPNIFSYHMPDINPDTRLSFSEQIRKCLNDNWVGYIHNFVRDFWWGFATTLSLGVVGWSIVQIADPAANWLPPTFYQLAVCAVAQSLYQLGYMYYHRNSEDFWEKRFRDSMGAFLAAYAAIFCWNYGQYLFESIGLNLGWSLIAASLFSAIGAGLGEGWVQYVVKGTFNTFYDTFGLKNKSFSENRQEQLNLKDFAFSIFPGLIPGLSWQVANAFMSVYANPLIIASANNPLVGLVLAAIATGVAINCTVMFFNVLFDAFTEQRKWEPVAKLQADARPLVKEEKALLHLGVVFLVVVISQPLRKRQLFLGQNLVASSK